MNTPIVRQRHLALIIIVVGLVVAAMAGTGAVSSAAAPDGPTAGPPGAPSVQAVTQSVLVARSAEGRDSLWVLSPSTGAPTAAGVLPGIAASVAVSPDGENVAYLPRGGTPRVWVGYGPLAPRTVSLTGAGVRRVDSFTWIDGRRLVVAGATARKAGPERDRLYLVDLVARTTAPFRKLQGTEPYVAPGGAKLVYVRLTVLKPATKANQYSATVRESLREVRLSGGKGRTVTSETYRLAAERRSFARPQLSRNGKWLLTAATGSDISVTYSLCDASGGSPLLSVYTGALASQAGWDAAGRTAFGGMPDMSHTDEACVWVYQPDVGRLTRTPLGLLPRLMVTDLAWSADGDLVAGARDWGTASRASHVIVLPGSLGGRNDLGRGRLPVWVTP